MLPSEFYLVDAKHRTRMLSEVEWLQNRKQEAEGEVTETGRNFYIPKQSVLRDLCFFEYVEIT